MEMKYGQLAESSKINDDIYEYFKNISEDDRRIFVKKFREQPHDENQVMHTLRELIVGAYLASRGFTVEYDRKIDGKTPDWVILDNARSLKCIVELVNFHIDKTTEDDINRRVRDEGSACYWPQPNNERLYKRIHEKADKYEELTKKHNVAYVVAVFSEFIAAVKSRELHQCLFEDYGGLFGVCPRLSGVLFFKESHGSYEFQYTENPYGLITLMI